MFITELLVYNSKQHEHQNAYKKQEKKKDTKLSHSNFSLLSQAQYISQLLRLLPHQSIST